MYAIIQKYRRTAGHDFGLDKIWLSTVSFLRSIVSVSHYGCQHVRAFSTVILFAKASVTDGGDDSKAGGLNTPQLSTTGNALRHGTGRSSAGGSPGSR